MSDDFRVDYLIEARRCIREYNKQSIEQPEFWANLLGGLFNATIASVSDDVVAGLYQRKERQDAARDHILAALDGR